MNVIYQVIAGSKAYGLDLPTSDTDIRGIFLLPNEKLLGFGYREQVNDRTNDVVHYELNRFVRLLLNNNPNIIENLFVPDNKIQIFDEKIRPLYDNRHKFLTKQIRNTFGGYAVSQIKKARGLNKKIVNPMDKERKTPLDFCYIFEKEDGYMMLAEQWLKKHGFVQEGIGLSEMPNGHQLYKVHYDWLALAKSENPRYKDITAHGFRGIVKEGSDEIRHSEIPKNFHVSGFLWYNKDGYTSYCKDYKEYWEWVEKRNPDRYNDNVSHNQNYDGKNMMHCIRMLETAIEIAKTGEVNLVRPNRDFLLSIRKGKVPYDEIMSMIKDRNDELNEAFSASGLPDTVDQDFAHDIIMQIRK
jgi:hypothetical protein